MTEQELRALVRDAIARHTGGGVATNVPGVAAVPASFLRHPSHGTFVLPAGADTDGPCIIEPAVMCNHCGYCKSYGH
jgi:hypothetical protein